MAERYRPAPPPRGARVWSAVLTVPALLGVIITGWLLLTPRHVAYHLSPDSLHLEAVVGGIDLGRVVPRADLGEARDLTLRRGPRYAGTGLPDLCEGLWDHAPVGEVIEASTCGSEAVLIPRTGDRPLLITPEDRDRFRADLASGASGDYPAAAGQGHRMWVLVLCWIAVIFGGAITALLILSPRRLFFEIADGALIIHTLWGRRSLPLAGARIEARPTGGLWLRVFGIGLPGHQLGHYRVAGRSMELYLSNREDAVLFVPAQGRPALISPDRRPAFLAALAAQGVAVDPDLSR